MPGRPVTRRAMIATGAGVLAAGLSGCTGTRSDPSRSRSEQTTGVTTPSPIERREYLLDLDSDSFDSWTGDVEAFEKTPTAIRGARSARLEPGYSAVRRPLEKTRADRYAIWWMVAPRSELHVGFESDSTAGFGFAARPGTGGAITVNPPKEGQEGGVSLYGGPNTEKWYRIVFSGVDFETEEFDVALRDAGDVELIRAKASFANSVTDISTISIRNMVPDGRGRVWVDNIAITTGENQ